MLNLTHQSKKNITKSFVTLLISVIGLIFLFPFLWMLVSSFKYTGQIYDLPIFSLSKEWISKTLTLSNYRGVLDAKDPPYYVFYFNSFKVAIIVLIGKTFAAAMAGYAFARIKFKGRDFIFLLYIGTLVIPFQVLMIPQFTIMRWLGIYNTHWALIFPSMFSALGTFLMRQYFLTIPIELTEASKIDGASQFQIFFKIMLPLAKPIIATMVILGFVWSWNDYMRPLIFLTSKELYTLPLALITFIDENGNPDDGLTIAAAMLAILPLMLTFIFAQKYFIKGVTAGSVKG